MPQNKERCECPECRNSSDPCFIYYGRQISTTCLDIRATEDWCQDCRECFPKELMEAKRIETESAKDREHDEKTALGY